MYTFGLFYKDWGAKEKVKGGGLLSKIKDVITSVKSTTKKRGIMLTLHPLPRGITGFTSYPGLLIAQDYKPFISLVYTVLKGALEWEDLELKGKNYYYFLIESKNHEYHILLNACFPYVAVAKSIENNKFMFMDSEEMKSQFKLLSECNYLLLGNEDLEQEISKSDLLDLDEAELKQIEYWKPKTISEIVFNNWD